MKISTLIPLPKEAVFDGFTLDLFKALKPPLVGLKVIRFDGCSVGDEVHLVVGTLIKQEWISIITQFGNTENEIFFVDQGKKLPFFLSQWKHKHRMLANSESSTTIIDEIEYSSGYKWMDFLLFPVLFLQFYYRKGAYKKFFKHQ